MVQILPEGENPNIRTDQVKESLEIRFNRSHPRKSVCYPAALVFYFNAFNLIKIIKLRKRIPIFTFLNFFLVHQFKRIKI